MNVQEEYDSCRISQEEPRVVAVCDNPNKPQQFTITFRLVGVEYIYAAFYKLFT